MTTAPRFLLSASLGALASTVLVLAAPQVRQAPASQQPADVAAARGAGTSRRRSPRRSNPVEIGVSITLSGGAAPRVAVPELHRRVTGPEGRRRHHRRRCSGTISGSSASTT